MTTVPIPPPVSSSSPPLAPDKPGPSDEGNNTRLIVLGVIGAIVALVLIVGLIWGAIVLAQNPAAAQVWRDIFIIFMALEFMFIGIALIVLIVQVAVLTNLLKHEVTPILQATNETIHTVRGTAVFVSENITEPVIKLNTYLAGLQKVVSGVSSLGSIFRKL